MRPVCTRHIRAGTFRGLERENNIACSAYDGVVAVKDEEDIGDGDNVFRSPYKFNFHIAAGVDIEFPDHKMNRRCPHKVIR
jgi:hypothetical protein